MANKYLDSTGLAHLWSKIKAWVANYAKITTSDGTSTLTVGSNNVTIPSKTSQITNDSGYITSVDIPEGAAASSTTPLMDGTASVGTETTFARGDHRHPSDTSKVTANAAITGATKTKITYDSKGLVTGGADLTATDIPTIPVSKLDGVTASAAELNILDGVTASTAELNILDGVTATTQEINYVDGVTSNVQTQLDSKADKVVNGTSGNLVTLDENGNLVDSGVNSSNVGTDTKNTAGGDDTSSKIFIVGMTAQTTNDGHSRTYTQDKAYVGANGHLYSNGLQVVNISDHQTLINKTLSSPQMSNPAITGTPIAPTAAPGTNTQQIATTAFVTTAVSNAGANYVQSSTVGAANGVAPLDANSKIDSQYLPSYVDDVVEVYARSGQTALSSTWLATESASGTVVTPEAGKIYVLMADSGDYTANSQFRWGGTAYVKLNDGGVSAITNAEIDSITSN